MIWHIVRKDWILLWPLVALVTIIQAALEWTDFNMSVVNSSAFTLELLRPLSVAWLLGIAALVVAVVQQDAIPGVEHDWLIRPLKRSNLLAAKLLFLFATVSLPMLALNLTHALMIGFPLRGVFGAIVYKELFTFVFFLLPLLALAAMTRNMSELMVMAVAIFVVYAVSTAAAALLFGAARCPTCDTGTVWLQHLLQHLELAGGGCLILLLQYGRRRTDISRVVAVVGAVALVGLQLPWSAAFAIQRHVAGVPGSAAKVEIQLAGSVDRTAGDPAARDRPVAGRQATRALMHGDIDKAADYVRGGKRDSRMGIDVPLRISGLADDELLLVDRTQVNVSANGRLADRSNIPNVTPSLFMPNFGEAGGEPNLVHQIFKIPGSAFPQAASPALDLDYSLTLMKVIEQHRVSAIDGEVRSETLGICRSQLEEDSVTVRCRQVGRAPFCLSATLYGPDGAHNPEVRKCQPDYRPYMPAFVFYAQLFWFGTAGARFVGCRALRGRCLAAERVILCVESLRTTRALHADCGGCDLIPRHDHWRSYLPARAGFPDSGARCVAGCLLL
jgi:hypothetical protein